MEITEVRIKLMEKSDDRLQAFCSITFDDAFVVRDLKIIDGSNGPFVAMPSRKLTTHCTNCGCKNHLRAGFCNQCGGRLKDDRTLRDHEGRTKLYADIAHPINTSCREMIQSRVIAEFKMEIERAEQPGYVSRYDDDYDMDFDPPAESQQAGMHPPASHPGASSQASPSQTASPRTSPSHSAPAPATPPVASDPPKERVQERTHVAQPAESFPRAPHRAPAQQPLPTRPDSSSRRSNDQFGAGIF